DALLPLDRPHREPLREQLRRGDAAPERHHRAARIARFREDPGPPRQRPQARAARRAQFHAPARALLREPGRRRATHEGNDRRPRDPLRLVRAVARGIPRHGLCAGRRLRLGAAHLCAARRLAHQPVRERAFAGAGGRNPDPRPRHVRACVPHGLRGGRESVRRRLPAQHRLARARATLPGRGAGAEAARRRAARIRRHRRHRSGAGRGDDGRREARAGDRRAAARLAPARARHRRRRAVARSGADPAMDGRALEVRAGGGVLRLWLPRRLQDGDPAARGGLRREVHEQRPLGLEGDRRAAPPREDARMSTLPGDPRPAALPAYSLGELARYMLRLGSLGFGGPVALVGAMHRDLVEERRWISESDYKEGLALAQLMPGPLAAQLAMYLGYVHYRIVGATLVGIAFVIPSFVMVVALGWAYVRYGGLAWMQAVFYGVGAAVIGIIALGAYKLTTKSVRRDALLWGIWLAAAAVTIVTETEMAWLFLAAGLVVWLVRAPPHWLRGTVRGLALPPLSAGAMLLPGADWPRLVEIAVYFA